MTELKAEALTAELAVAELRLQAVQSETAPAGHWARKLHELDRRQQLLVDTLADVVALHRDAVKERRRDAHRLDEAGQLERRIAAIRETLKPEDDAVVEPWAPPEGWDTEDGGNQC